MFYEGYYGTIGNPFVYLERFFRNLLLGEAWDLRSRYLYIAPPKEWLSQPNVSVQTAKPSEKKQKPSVQTTKTSVQIIKLLRDNPTYTAAKIAEVLGKSTRAIEMQLANLSAKHLLRRVGANKNGHWEVTDN